MPSETDLFLNQLAQRLVSESDGSQWFRQLTGSKQQETLSKLWLFAAQAGAQEEDVDLAISRAKLKATFTPCALLKNGRLKMQATKILNLPQAEREKSFRLLLALFQIADERRRSTMCATGCSHWWHATIQRS